MTKKKTILLVGGTGFIGQATGIALCKAGYRINLLSRKPQNPENKVFPHKEYIWGPQGEVPDGALRDVRAVINLAGEPIAEGRWTQSKKDRITNSRYQVTQSVVNAANEAKTPLLIQSSAIGIYGDKNGQKATESTPPARGWLCETTERWEKPLSGLSGNTRIVTMRLGVVIGLGGGALNEMIAPYKLGFGARLGNGNINFNWIHIDDVVQFILTSVENKSYEGVYNLVAPEKTNYAQLHESLLSYFYSIKKAFVPISLIKGAFGEKSQIITNDVNVEPARLLDGNFKFKYGTLEKCLADLLYSDSKGCETVKYAQWVPASEESVWEYFSTEKNLEKITPSFMNFKVISKSTPKINKNTTIKYSLKIRGIPLKWTTLITNFEPTKTFTDDQISGPYKTWNHSHDFTPLGQGTLIEDTVHFKIPIHILGMVILLPFVKKEVSLIFEFRKKTISQIFN